MPSDGCINVLVVASEEDYSSLTERLGLRYNVSHAREGGDALAAIERQPIDVLVTTAALPDMSGSDLIARTVRHAGAPSSILIHDSAVSRGIGNLGMPDGNVEHLNRPVGEFTLMKAIDDAGARGLQEDAS